MIDNLEDPQNLGQIVRTSECFGVEGIIIPKHKSVGVTNTVLQVSQGAFLDVTDEEIIHAYQLLGSEEGIFCEPASAASVAGLLKRKEVFFTDYLLYSILHMK